MVEHLTSLFEALDSILSMTKKKKKDRRGKNSVLDFLKGDTVTVTVPRAEMSQCHVKHSPSSGYPN